MTFSNQWRMQRRESSVLFSIREEQRWCWPGNGRVTLVWTVVLLRQVWGTRRNVNDTVVLRRFVYDCWKRIRFWMTQLYADNAPRRSCCNSIYRFVFCTFHCRKKSWCSYSSFSYFGLIRNYVKKFNYAQLLCFFSSPDSEIETHGSSPVSFVSRYSDLAVNSLGFFSNDLSDSSVVDNDDILHYVI